MLGLARQNDVFIGECFCHPPQQSIPMEGIIVTCSRDTLINNFGAARITDIVIGNCGHIGLIVSGSGNIKINNLDAARIGDSVVGDLVGIICTASGNSTN